MTGEAELFEQALKKGVHACVERYLSTRSDLAGKVVVDLACGDGRTTALLQALGARVLAFDLFPESCKLKDPPQFADVQQPLPISSGSVDMVVLQEVIEHLPNQLLTLQEICRILKPGGELLLTTPSRSSLEGRLSYLCFESEHLRATPWGGVSSGVWGDQGDGRKYYGHLWLIGIQQLNALSSIAGFRSLEVLRSDVSKSSVVLFCFFYPLILLISLRALYRDLRHQEKGGALYREKWTQWRLNVHPRHLINRHLIALLRK